MGFLPGLMVRNPRNKVAVGLWSAASAVLCAACIALWQEVMGINKFWPMFLAVNVSNIPVNLILTPIAVGLLIGRVQARGLYWKELPEAPAEEA